MLRRLATGAAVTLLAAVLVVGFGQAATAESQNDASASATSGTAASPEMFAAMQRDLGLSAEQARARLVADDRAAGTERRLRGALGVGFAGAWLTPDAGRLVVAVTDASKVAAVAAAGAQPMVVTRSEAQLAAVVAGLDARAAVAPASVTGWYVDVATNSVVVTATAAVEAAAAFVAGSGVDASAVRVVASTETPRPLFDVRGGDAYYMGGRCSIGFSVRGGFVTAGHCGRPGTRTQGFNRVSQGSFQGSSFPGNDYAWVRVNANWVPRGVVNNYRGGLARVAGSAESSVGASICRSGSTTGWRCGTVQAKNQTVRYSQGAVGGLTRTNACAEPGDSGGSWLSGTQAQGVTSGGSGNCTFGGTTYFQPVNEILSTYRLQLVTS